MMDITQLIHDLRCCCESTGCNACGKICTGDGRCSEELWREAADALEQIQTELATLKEQSTANVAPVVHSKWKRPILESLLFKIKYKSPYFHCANCGNPVRRKKLIKYRKHYRFCSFCGAKMDLGAKNDV